MVIRYQVITPLNDKLEMRAILIPEICQQKNETIILSYAKLYQFIQKDMKSDTINFVISQIKKLNQENQEFEQLDSTTLIYIHLKKPETFQVLCSAVTRDRMCSDDYENKEPIKKYLNDLLYEDKINYIRIPNQVENEGDFYTSEGNLFFLYSSALIYQENGKKSILPIKNIRLELNTIKNAFDLHSFKLDILESPLTLGTLENSLSRKPKILHIICHGYCDRIIHSHSPVFFENPTFNGTANKITKEDLESRIKSKKGWTETLFLIFINCCNSTPIKEAFINAGYKGYFIEIHPSEEFKDEASTYFIKEFYLGIAQRKSVKAAYENAQKNVNSDENKIFQACCCFHSHKSQCWWVKKISEDNLNPIEAHQTHIPICKCMVLGKMHNSYCSFAVNFYKGFSNVDKDYIEWKAYCERFKIGRAHV